MLTTFTGRRIDLIDMQPSDICIEDIAHSLACVNRFNGHTVRPVSVAQHSVYVKRLVDGTPFALQALLHDASEAYIGDVTKWLKQSPGFCWYRELEDHIQRMIWARFGCPEEQADLVSAADKLMVRYEAHRVHHPICVPGTTDPHAGYPPPSQDEIAMVGPWNPWPWRIAKDVFLVEFKLAGGVE